MRHHKKITKKSSHPGPSGKSRRAKYCNDTGRPNKFTPGWVMSGGELVHVGLNEDGSTKSITAHSNS
jgi:hypothetical protein